MKVNEDFTSRVTYSYMIGVYAAVNAIRDLYLLVEGPDCAHMKTQFIMGNQDLLSTLVSVSGFHRVANTALHPAQMTGSREVAIRESLAQIASHEAVPAVMLTSMPMAFVTGADYERICRQVAAETGKPVVHVPGKSLSGDWIDGYAESLFALARQLDLSNSRTDPKKVAIVGYLFDRNEGDSIANIEVLKTLFREIGLNLVSVWLDGGLFSDLYKVSEAGTIISFPYGRKAARWLASRTNARLIECDLPFGLDATERMLRAVSRELTGGSVELIIERELARIVPRLEWVVPYIFQNRDVAFVGDPYLVRGMKEVFDLLGARLRLAIITNTKARAKGLVELLGPQTEVLIWPRMRQMFERLRLAVERDGVSLIVGNTAGIGLVRGAFVEIGFPSMYTHSLFERPYLGFDGFLAFVDMMVNAIRHEEVRQGTISLSRLGITEHSQ